MEIVNTESMRKMDAKATYEYGIPGITLMKHAAITVMDCIREHVAKGSRTMILCDPGNNGGDGFALVRLVVEGGYSHVRIHCNIPYNRMSHDETMYAKIAESHGVEIMGMQDMGMIEPALDEAQVVIDALFGTGLSRNIESSYDILILHLSLLNKHVISIGVASGVNRDTGSTMDCAVQSDVTITFEYLKRRQLLYPGSSYCRDVIIKNITLPKAVKANIKHNIHLLDENAVRAFLPKRDTHSHKGSFGRVVMVGGSSYMHGAVTLVTKAALQSGTGTLTLFLPDYISEVISMKLEGGVLLPAPSTSGSFSMIPVDLLKCNPDVYDMIVTGNGVERSGMTQAIARAVLESDRLCLLDGDALYEAGKLIKLLHRLTVTILTPHPKETSYLCGYSMKEVLRNPLRHAMEFVKRYESTVLVLEDQHTIIYGKDDTYMNTVDNHALAKGGSRDVLCGILTGLYAQGKEALQAAAVVVYVHACAADEPIQRVDTYNIQPGDLITVLSDTYGKLKG